MPTQKPASSIVIPIHDRIQELHECLVSALSQDDVEPYEVICVLDGSPDPTRRLVEEFASSSDMVRILSRSSASGNAVRARNLGILAARSDVILLLDSDDVMCFERVRRTREAFGDSALGLVAGCAKYFGDGSRDLGIPFGETQVPLEISSALLSRINPFVTSTVALRRSTLLRYGGFRSSLEYREDHELWLRLAINRVRMLMVPEVFAHYRVHSGNNEMNFTDTDDHWRMKMYESAQLPFANDEWGAGE